MGGVWSACWECIKGKSGKTKFLLLGLDNAGKTTLFYRYKLQQSVTTTPTIGFNVEQVCHQRTSFTVMDVGGQERVRHLWKHYLTDAQGIIFVVDSNDFGRLTEARKEMHAILDSEELPSDAVLLVLANKQDLPFAKSPAKISEELGFEKIKGSRRRYLQATNALTGEGTYEGLTWLAKNIR